MSEYSTQQFLLQNNVKACLERYTHTFVFNIKENQHNKFGTIICSNRPPKCAYLLLACLRMYLLKNADSGQLNYLYIIQKIGSSQEKSFRRHQSVLFCFNISKQICFYFLLPHCFISKYFFLKSKT